MKKVTLIVLNNFLNDSRVLKEAITLQSMGFTVQVAALHEDPLEEFEKINTISVHRIKLKSRGWSKKKIVQILKYFEYIYRFIKYYKKSDFIHCNDLNSLPMGVVIKKIFNKNTKVIYDAHEYEINAIPNQSKFSIKLKYILEKLLIKYTDSVITVSNAIANEYVKLYNIKKPYLVLNTPPLQEVKKHDFFRKTFNIAKEEKIFLYQGGLTCGRGIEILLESFKENKNTIVFMGYGNLERLVREYANKYTNIFYHEAASPDILLNYTSSADFGILFYENNCLNHNFCSPNKMFEYIMADLPVIVSNLHEMKNLVETYKIGIVAKENSPEELSRAVEEIKNLDEQEFKKNLKKARKIFNWQEQEKVLKGCYNVWN